MNYSDEQILRAWQENTWEARVIALLFTDIREIAARIIKHGRVFE